MPSTCESYDYIICGGGTSGCVIARRLADNLDLTILVIEAGPDSNDLENVHMTGGWNKNFGKSTDWNIVTPPMPGVNNRRVNLSRGRLLGGSSGVNGTLCIRGSKQDYDNWDLDGWSGEEVFQYMNRAETFHPKPWYNADASDHGFSGPLDIKPHDLAPISQRMLDSFVSSGLPFHNDLGTVCGVPNGCGHAPRTVYKGVRSTAADFLTDHHRRENITIKTDMTVDRVILEQSKEQWRDVVDGATKPLLRATGVTVVTASGLTETYLARREVIVSSGAYCSPPILMRSGLGRREEKEKHGIECLKELDGVGRNLMDHVIVFIFYETTQHGLTTDHKLYHKGNMANSLALWKDQQQGIFSTFPFGSIAFSRLDDRLNEEPIWKEAQQQKQKDESETHTRHRRDPFGLTPDQPHIEFFMTECYGGPLQFTDFPHDHQHAFSIIANLLAPKSRGYVSLASRDPLQVPIVNCKFLDDELDVLVLSEACRFANDIVVRGAGTKDIIRYHSSGTCVMCKDNDPQAVVDNKLRVRGVSGLRVADCSIMPGLIGGHTQMPAYAIGEKCADLIKETWTAEVKS
ncbi:hypothetical protein ASPZODRAFT_159767 [Penicilliopsis zonata CBS 506.65]|uniref:Glucose-methanol-choline oxidoreductase N-terminal domain-containing protein n=1 Tax=Penicilliopsis zonata CBS 506.65 TaxID=1073090 RepID=A0A1L9SGN6_9EURO|nr:hypothetical protein ASPZODRAFT_159767 [Penicilliopsis zonata CBS 506.65]OJJ46214.1 hypothetical protein ASPZODRAFT_159767 [Penicilliopsis zonata CBS 506.65]